MKSAVLATLFTVLVATKIAAAPIVLPPAIEWERVYGTRDYHERLTAVAQTEDGGFLFGGISSDLDDGYLDWFVVRVTSTGRETWHHTFGGSDEDELACVVQTRDGGFILGGISSSPAYLNKTGPYRGGLGDWWVVRLDGDGNTLWDRTYGGSGREQLWVVREMLDGGFILAGASSSTNDTKHSPYYGGFEDGWIVRLDAEGNVEWERSFGGTGDESIRDVQPTPDGGFIAVAYSDSPTNAVKSAAGFGNLDFWILRLDAMGRKLWDRTYGGKSRDFPVAVQVVPDGGFVVAGATSSMADGNKLRTNHAAAPSLGTSDYWMIRLEEDGDRLWEEEFGGRSEDVPLGLQRTTDGGFVLAGFTMSGEGGNKTSDSRGGFDYWVVRTDANGRWLWDETYGGSESDYLGAFLQTRDGGFLAGGYSSSDVSGNKSVPNIFGEDFWVLKFVPDALTAPPHLRWEPCCFDDLLGYNLLLRGSSNQTYRIEFSEDLVQWTRLSEVLATDAEVVVFSSSPEVATMRFFRAVLVLP